MGNVVSQACGDEGIDATAWDLAHGGVFGGDFSPNPNPRSGTATGGGLKGARRSVHGQGLAMLTLSHKLREADVCGMPARIRDVNLDADESLGNG